MQPETWTVLSSCCHAALHSPVFLFFLLSQCVVSHPSIFIQDLVMASYLTWLGKFSCTAEIKSRMSSYCTVFNVVTCSGGRCSCLLEHCFKKPLLPAELSFSLKELHCSGMFLTRMCFKLKCNVCIWGRESADWLVCEDCWDGLQSLII